MFVSSGKGANGNEAIIDAIGPETFTFEELVRAIARAIGRKPRIIHVPPGLVFAYCRVIGAAMGDVMLTREEIRGLMDDLLCTDSPPAGDTRLTDWLTENASTVGRICASELARRTDRERAYDADGA